jgi:hypothetical protein
MQAAAQTCTLSQETVYHTDLFTRFCDAWKLATSAHAAVGNTGDVKVSR